MRLRVLVALSAMALAACGQSAPPPSTADAATQPAGGTVADHFAPPRSYPGPTWTKAGRQVDAEELNSIAGPDHCGWQSAVLLHVGWPLGTVSRSSSEIRQYVRDPVGVFAAVVDEKLTVGTGLPPDAEDTGYRSGGLELWLSAAEPDAAFLRVGNDVERWPRTASIIACE